MSEMDQVFKSLAEGLKAFARAIETVAERIEASPGAGAVRGYEGSARSGQGVQPPKRRQTKKEKGGTDTQVVYAIIERHPDGVDVESIGDETGFDRRKIYNAIYRLKKQDMIKSEKKGVYTVL